MKINILTLFPKMFDGFTTESIIKRAIDNKKVDINLVDFRKYSTDKHNKVDDTPYGGGSGMVLMCQPIFDAINDIKEPNSKVILLSPQGTTFDQEKAYELSKEENLIFICGHYEGFDERIKSICDEELSIGDYVLTGGELASMVICDSVIRLLPGVIEEESHVKDSFNDNLLDYPTYTKPRNYNGMDVPDVLLSGDHKKIDEWRHNQQLIVTEAKRPDLLNRRVVLKKNGLKTDKNIINVEDIKDIKVTPIDEVYKSNKYKLYKDERTIAVTLLDPSKLVGYKLRGIAKDNTENKIVIINHDFICCAALKNVRKKVDMLAYHFDMALEDDDDEDGANRVLGEAEMLRSAVISTYASYLGNENLEKIIRNINNLISEFVRRKTLKNSFAYENYKMEERKNRIH